MIGIRLILSFLQSQKVLGQNIKWLKLKVINNEHNSGKRDISDQKNDQIPHINDHFWFGDRWWLIYCLLLGNQNWSFIAC